MKHILIAAAASLLFATPAFADTGDKDKRERSERSEKAKKADRAPSPYSNRTQARKRTIREAVKEAGRPRRGTYRFRRNRDDR